MQDAHKTDPWAGVEQGQSSGVSDSFNEKRDDPRNAGREMIPPIDQTTLAWNITDA